MKAKKSLIGLMVLCAAGAVTTGALAFQTHQASKSLNETLDSAIYLYWGAGESGATISKVDDLVEGVTQYRALSVSPAATKSVNGTVRVSFQTEFEQNYSAKGLTIKVYGSDTVEHAEAGQYTTDALSTFVGNTANYSTTETVTNDFTSVIEIPVTAGSAAAKVYAIEFVYVTTTQDSGYEFGGAVKVNQSFQQVS